MTCRAARRLLPLFAGGDLRAPETSAVASHVAACAACRAEVGAFAAARSLLPLSSLSFAESDGALVRRRVLDEIARRRGSPSPTVAFLHRPRFALAALAGAIVLAAALVSPFFVRNAVEQVGVVPARPAPPATPVTAGERIAEAEHIAEPAPSRPDRPTAISRSPRATAASRPRVPAPGKPGPAMRFEIQTGNVNVRIIWFAGGTSGEKPSSGPAGETNGVS